MVLSLRAITPDNLIVLEGAKRMDSQSLTKLLSEILLPIQWTEWHKGEEYRKLLTIFTSSNDPCLLELRELMKPHLMNRISGVLKGFQFILQNDAIADKVSMDTASQTINIIHELNDNPWLSSGFNPTLRQFIELAPSKEKVFDSASYSKVCSQ